MRTLEMVVILPKEVNFPKLSILLYEQRNQQFFTASTNYFIWCIENKIKTNTNYLCQFYFGRHIPNGSLLLHFPWLDMGNPLNYKAFEDHWLSEFNVLIMVNRTAYNQWYKCYKYNNVSNREPIIKDH
jgi:hypothetical protein